MIPRRGTLVVALVVLAWCIVAARAQEHAHGTANGHPPQDQAIHERFYSNWMRPDDPELSCCNKKDCYPAEFKNVGGTWFAKRREDGAWIPIPAQKFEMHRDNPDGRNHICMQAPGSVDAVFCAILGAGL
jgi:hypothetical protein